LEKNQGEENGRKTMLTCPNNKCGKIFDKPLQTINLQQDSNSPYNSCPYCFTEITILESEIENPPEESFTQTELEKEVPTEVLEKTIICNHHLGYLKEKELKQQIPEECILCTRVIDCMLESSP
jgi:DNA-directed RNA polymerase subunit RPC12/RpoP